METGSEVYMSELLVIIKIFLNSIFIGWIRYGRLWRSRGNEWRRFDGAWRYFCLYQFESNQDFCNFNETNRTMFKTHWMISLKRVREVQSIWCIALNNWHWRTRSLQESTWNSVLPTPSERLSWIKKILRQKFEFPAALSETSYYIWTYCLHDFEKFKLN